MRRVLLLLALLMLTACGADTGGTTTPVATAVTAASSASSATSASMLSASSEPAGSPQALRAITMAMPYTPNIQFAHFYVADKKGYYARQGLKVSFDYNYETDVVQRIVQGSVQFGLSSGDSVLLARAQGLPVVTVATNSQKFPVVLFSKADQNIKTPADLRGKSVGIPGHFGASYIGLLALLYANHLSESDLNVQDIGFTQLAAVSQGKVQVGVGYANNEPLVLSQQGVNVNVMRVSDYYPLASDGLITNASMVSSDQAMVHGFVQATLQGMRDVLANPEEAFSISLDYVPELRKADQSTQALQKRVLQETMTYWQSDVSASQGLGYIDQHQWQATEKFLTDSKLLKHDVDLSQAFTNQFIKP